MSLSLYLSFYLTYDLFITIICSMDGSHSYVDALQQAKNELASAVAELGEAQNRALELEQRIVDLRQTVSVLSKLCGQEDIDIEESLGLTDAIRSAFAIVGKESSLTVQEVRLRLEAQGFNTRRYGNLLASIHTVVRRLEAKHEIRHIGTKDGKPAYVVTDQGLAVCTMKGIGKIVSAWLMPKLMESKK